MQHYTYIESLEGDGSSSDEWGDYGVAGDDYKGPPVFDDDQYEEESMPVYDTDIEDVIEEEEGCGKEDLVRKKTTSKTSSLWLMIFVLQ
ncbi:hypothetical protein Tco_1139911 [Tanacetum coccineum]